MFIQIPLALGDNANNKKMQHIFCGLTILFYTKPCKKKHLCYLKQKEKLSEHPNMPTFATALLYILRVLTIHLKSNHSNYHSSSNCSNNNCSMNNIWSNSGNKNCNSCNSGNSGNSDIHNQLSQLMKI